MKKLYQLDDNGRIRLTADVVMVGTIDGEVFDFPDDFDFCHQHEYKINEGELVYDPPEEDDAPTMDDRVTVLEKENADLKEIINALLGGDRV